MSRRTTRPICLLIICVLFGMIGSPISAIGHTEFQIDQKLTEQYLHPINAFTDFTEQIPEPPVVTDPPPVVTDPPPVVTDPPPVVTDPPPVVTDPPPVVTDPPPVVTDPPPVVTDPPPVVTDPPEPEWTPAPEPTAEATPYVQQQTTPKPSPSASPNSGKITRPKAELKDSTVSSNVEKESNYVTFAKLDLQNNSLASNLFFAGLVCVFLGAGGLVTLVILFVRNRNYVRDEKEGIFEEIEMAESRNTYVPITSRPIPKSKSKVPQGKKSKMSDTMPIKTADPSMYTEEQYDNYDEVDGNRNLSQDTARLNFANPKQSSNSAYSTEEILLEARNNENDF